MDQIAGAPNQTRQIWILFGVGAVLSIVLGVIGLAIGKRR